MRRGALPDRRGGDLTIERLSAADYRRMPWRNGAGETAEVAVEPPGAALDDILWRVAIADLPESGPFSSYLGIDRTLYLLPGPPVTLVVDGVAHDLAALESLDFPGEATTGVLVEEGPTRDLNVMARRGAVHVAHRALEIRAGVVLERPAGSALLHVAKGAVLVDGLALARGETGLWRGQPAGSIEVAPAGSSASLIWVTLVEQAGQI